MRKEDILKLKVQKKNITDDLAIKISKMQRTDNNSDEFNFLNNECKALNKQKLEIEQTLRDLPSDAGTHSNYTMQLLIVGIIILLILYALYRYFWVKAVLCYTLV